MHVCTCICTCICTVKVQFFKFQKILKFWVHQQKIMLSSWLDFYQPPLQTDKVQKRLLLLKSRYKVIVFISKMTKISPMSYIMVNRSYFFIFMPWYHWLLFEFSVLLTKMISEKIATLVVFMEGKKKWKKLVPKLGPRACNQRYTAPGWTRGPERSLTN